MADMYSAIYDDRFRKVARKAFIAGAVFCEMLVSGDIDARDICEDFFRALDDMAGSKYAEGVES